MIVAVLDNSTTRLTLVGAYFLTECKIPVVPLTAGSMKSLMGFSKLK